MLFFFLFYVWYNSPCIILINSQTRNIFICLSLLLGGFFFRSLSFIRCFWRSRSIILILLCRSITNWTIVFSVPDREIVYFFRYDWNLEAVLIFYNINICFKRLFRLVLLSGWLGQLDPQAHILGLSVVWELGGWFFWTTLIQSLWRLLKYWLLLLELILIEGC